MAAPAFIQPKLQTSKPGDPFEQEADQTADKVTRLSEPSTLSSASIKPPDENVQRKCSTCEEKEKVQKKGRGRSAAKNVCEQQRRISAANGR
ncbi:MAG: hypothetical protein WKG06_15975 [Segetibacter sp.]